MSEWTIARRIGATVLAVSAVTTACAAQNEGFQQAPSPEATIAPQLISASKFSMMTAAQEKNILEKNLEKQIEFDVDKSGWEAKDSARLPFDKDYKYIDLVSKIDTQKRISLLVTKDEYARWKITGWNFPQTKEGVALPVHTRITCLVVNFEFRAVPRLRSVNGFRF